MLRTEQISALTIALKKQGVWHTVALPNTLKYLKTKKELWKLKYFTMKKYNLQKIPSKKPKSFNILL
jgi:hypothetical protein